MATRKLGVLRIDMITNTAGFTAPMTNATRVSRNSANSIQDDFRRISNSSDIAGNSVKNFGNLLRTAGALVGVGSLASLADSYTNLTNRLKLVTDGQESLQTALDSTLEIAQRTALEWDAVGLTFEKITKGTEKLGLSQQEVIDLTKTVSEAVAISGVSSEVAAQGLTQFGQALSVGVLRGQDLNSTISSLPGLANAIAAGLGVTSGELKKLGAEGKLTNEVILNSIKEMSTVVAAQYDQTATSIGGALTMVKNAATEYVGEVDKGVGASSALVGLLGSLAKNFAGVADVLALAAWAVFTKWIVSQAVSIKTLIGAKMADLAATRAQQAAEVQQLALRAQQAAQNKRLALAELDSAKNAVLLARTKDALTAAESRLRLATLASITATNQATAATAAHTAATRVATGVVGLASTALRGLLALFGGPIGLIVTLASVAAGYFFMNNAAKEATVELDYQNKSVKELTYAYQSLSQAKLAETLVALGAEVSEISEKMNEAQKDVVKFTKSFDLTDTSRQKLNELNSAFTNGKISQDEYLKSVSNINGVTSDMVVSLGNVVAKYEDQRVAFDKNIAAQRIVNKLSAERNNLSKENAASTAAESREIAKQAELLAGINEKYTTSLKEQQFIENSINKNRKAFGGSTELAKEFAEFDRKFREDNNLSIDIALTKQQLELLGKSWNLRNREKKIEEQITREKQAQTEAQKKAQKAIEAQQKANEGVLKISKQVAENAKKYNFAGLESKYNLPAGTLSAIHAIETGNSGRTNQVNSRTGASGGFQFMPDTAKRFGVSVMDMASSAEGAAKYMNYLIKFFKGDMDKAVRAYHAGEGNVQRGTNLGKYNNDYIAKFKGYQAGTSGLAFNENFTAKDYIKDLEEQFEAIQKFNDEREKLEKEFTVGKERIALESQEKIDELTKYGLSERAKYEETLLVERYKLYDAELQLELNAYKMNEGEKAKAERDIAKLRLKLSGEYSKNELNLRLKSIDAAYDYEIRKHIELSQISAYEAIDGVSQVGRDAQYNMDARSNPRLAQIAQFETEYEQSLVELTERSMAARKQIEEDEYLNEEQKYENLLELEAEFRESKEKLQQEANEREREMNDALLQSQLESYGTLMNGALDVLKGYAGESSGVYRTLFAGLRAYNTAVAAMNVWKAASDAYATEPGTVWQKSAAALRAVAETQAFATMIQGITPNGFADGGYTGAGGKHDVAGLVHRGEVVFSQRDVSNMGGVGQVEKMRLGGQKFLNQQSSVYNNIVNNSTTKDSSNQSINIANIVDPAMVKSILNSKDGKKWVINIIKDNASEVRMAAGVR